MNSLARLVLGSILTIISMQWWSNIPSLTSVTVFLFVAQVCRKRLPAILIGIIIGCFVVTASVNLYQYRSSIAQTVTKDITIAGTFERLVSDNKKLTRQIFHIDSMDELRLSWLKQFKISVFVRKSYPFQQGQRWQLKINAREPYGRLNEAGFDLETYFLANGIHSKGSLIEAKLLANTPSLRQRWFNHIYKQLEKYPHKDYLLALAFGERSQLTTEDWQFLQHTGLAHLLAISGLHIGLAYLFGFLFFRTVIPLFSRRDRLVWLPALLGFGSAFAYAWLAGFSLPAQRAMLALSLVLFLRWKGMYLSPMTLFLFALGVILVCFPFSVFSASFWLSFGAVFILCVFSLFNRYQWESSFVKRIWHYAKTLFLMQLFLLVGMLPIMVAWFGGVSLTAIVTNFFAVPVVSFITVPAILIALVTGMTGISNIFWALADHSLAWVLIPAEWLTFGWLPIWHLPSYYVLIAASLLTFCLIFIRLRIKVFLFVTVLFLGTWRNLKQDEPTDWTVDVFDVGHGLAVLIEKNGHAILYDTGAAWGNMSIAQLVVEPVLSKRGTTLDGIILSHFDNDHAGGYDRLLNQLSPHWIRASDNTGKHLPCVGGETWEWQALTFRVLYPYKLVDDPKNEDSCVVHISDGFNSILLTGDLPESREKYVLDAGDDISSEVILVPHHGSKTSSSEAFLSAVKANVAIASTGRYTPWNLPNPTIIDRYKALGIKWYQTDKDGQISVSFSQKGWKITAQRRDIAPYWYR